MTYWFVFWLSKTGSVFRSRNTGYDGKQEGEGSYLDSGQSFGDCGHLQ